MAAVRAARVSDHAAVAAVAEACDESGAVSGADARYLAHVESRGGLSVAEDSGALVGFAGRVDLDGVAFLTDLFVRPAERGAGHGSALLASLWDGSTSRATSSSQDPRALASYARFGAQPRWPLLYLEIAGAQVTAQVPVHRDAQEPGDAGWLLPLDGLETLRVVSGPGRTAMTAVVRTHGSRVTVLRAETADPRGLAVLVADLRTGVGADGVVALTVPGPHPALPDLLDAGARVVDVDLWCATDDAVDLVDPVRTLPSPSLG
jgi:GNAT superfamily N-acetyltransferase